MSDSTIIILLCIVLAVILAMVAYIVRGKYRQKHNPPQYNWKPEQDYDVVLRGETPMTPGFPVLKKRGEKTRGTDSDE